MQQVGSEVFLAGARRVQPGALAYAVRPPRRRWASNWSRAWVLHRGKLVKGFVALGVLVAGVAAYQLREPVGQGAGHLLTLAQGELAEAGLAVGKIEITGQALSSEQDIWDALGIAPNTSTVSFDAEAARQRIADLPSVASVSVRKVYPGDLIVTLTEKVPVARWRVDGITFVVDANGEQIGEDRGAYGELPLVVGDGAADDALVMIRALQGVPMLEDGLVALSRIADRRWDLIYDTGLRVQLPEQGVAQALRKLAMYQTDYRLLERDISLIDLRIDTIVAVRPNAPAEPEDEETTDP